MNETLTPIRAVAVETARPEEHPALITCHTLAAGQGKECQSTPKAAIVCILEGSVAVKTDDCRERIVRSGELFLLPRGKGYYAYTLSDNTRVVVCRFDLRSRLSDCHSLAGLIPYRSQESEFHVLQIKPRMEQYFALLESYLVDGITSAPFLEAKKRELFYQLFTYYPPQQTAALLNPILSDDLGFREFVMCNHLKTRSVVELAQLANYSTSGFIKRFEKTFREPPGEWMTRQRTAKVLEELHDQAKPIKLIAEDCGFSSYEHLWDFCKRHFGTSPAAIRRQAKSAMECLL